MKQDSELFVMKYRTKRKGVLLFSGGLDSTLARLALDPRDVVVALSISLPGRPSGEKRAAAFLATKLTFETFIDLEVRGDYPRQQPLTNPTMEGWIPYRNLMFWSIAAHTAVSVGASYVVAGHENSDSLAFSDASREYFDQIQNLLRLNGNRECENGIDVVLPLLDLTEDDSDSLAADNLQTISHSWSCWRDEEEPCNECAACLKRRVYLRKIRTMRGESEINKGI